MRVIGWAKNNVALIAIGVVTVVIAMALGSWSMGLGGGVTLGIALATAVVAWAIFRRRHGDVIPAGGHWPLPKVGTSVLMALALVLVAIQVVPYGRRTAIRRSPGSPHGIHPEPVNWSQSLASIATATKWSTRGTPMSPRCRGPSRATSTRAATRSTSPNGTVRRTRQMNPPRLCGTDRCLPATTRCSPTPRQGSTTRSAVS